MLPEIDVRRLKAEIYDVERDRESGWAELEIESLRRLKDVKLQELLKEFRPGQDEFWVEYHKRVGPTYDQISAAENRYSTKRLQLLYTLLSHTRGKLHRINKTVPMADGSGRHVTVPITMEEQYMMVFDLIPEFILK